jgi:hypothetical protein
MIESPTAAKAEPKAKRTPGTVEGIVVLSIAGFCIFALSAIGWHAGSALVAMLMKVCG